MLIPFPMCAESHDGVAEGTGGLPGALPSMLRLLEEVHRPGETERLQRQGSIGKHHLEMYMPVYIWCFNAVTIYDSRDYYYYFSSSYCQLNSKGLTKRDG